MGALTALALIGDIVHSRRLESARRYALQEDWTDLFRRWRDEAGPGTVARPTITLGDEFQGLFRADADGATSALALMERAADAARPAVVRFGLGLGEVVTPLREEALGMDGPCFHRARAALEAARDDGHLCRLEAAGGAADRAWSALASYCLRDRSDWSDPQWEAITVYQELGSWAAVADRLGVTRGAISQRQQAAGWDLYRFGWEGLRAELARRLDAGGRA